MGRPSSSKGSSSKVPANSWRVHWCWFLKTRWVLENCRKRGGGRCEEVRHSVLQKTSKIEIILTLGIELVNYYVLTSLCLEKIKVDDVHWICRHRFPLVSMGNTGAGSCATLASCEWMAHLARQINRVSSGCGLWKLRRRMKNAPTQKFYSNFDICPLASHLINCFTWKNHTWHNFTRVFSVPSCSRKQKSSSWRRWAFFHDYTPYNYQF